MMPLWLLENCFDVGTRRFPRFLALHWCSGASRRSRLPVAFAAFWVGKAKSSYAARRVPTSANIFLITEAVFCKFNLPTSRFARKHLATKGFGAGGVAPTPPVNLPSEPRP